MIAVVNSGGANISSVNFALKRLGAEVTFTNDPNIISNADGSILYQSGKTEVICTATFESKVPEWLTNGGWITAEYSMLPASTSSRVPREISRGKKSPRSQEIQRLIGRSLRGAIDLTNIPGNSIYVDCDVINADGGTRKAQHVDSSSWSCEGLPERTQKRFFRRDAMDSMIFRRYRGELFSLLFERGSNRRETLPKSVSKDSGRFLFRTPPPQKKGEISDRRNFCFFQSLWKKFRFFFEKFSVNQFIRKLLVSLGNLVFCHCKVYYHQLLPFWLKHFGSSCFV